MSGERRPKDFIEIRPSLLWLIESPFAPRWLLYSGVLLVIGLLELLAARIDLVSFEFVGSFLLLVVTIGIVLYRVWARVRLQGDRIWWRGIFRERSFSVLDVMIISYDPLSSDFTMSNPETRSLRLRSLLRLHRAFWTPESLRLLAEQVWQQRSNKGAADILVGPDPWGERGRGEEQRYRSERRLVFRVWLGLLTFVWILSGLVYPLSYGLARLKASDLTLAVGIPTLVIGSFVAARVFAPAQDRAIEREKAAVEVLSALAIEHRGDNVPTLP